MAKTLLIVLVVLLIIIAVPAMMAIGIRNNMVTLDETVNNAWANVETVLQRRYDLIPNLVNTVKGYAAQEKGVLEEVTRLRSQWGEAKTVSEKAETATAMESALSRLMVVVEQYPELKSNQNFLALQDELAGTENRISVERRRYNDAVRDYNVTIRKFPNSLFAGLFGFEKRTPFEAAAGAGTAPQVQF
ncbi:MAG: LemA family protein [Lentisphaerota bacterium]